ALVRLQGLQLEGGRWPRGVDVPESLPIGSRPLIGESSRWTSLAAATAVLYYAVEADLPRLYPQKPA
ncbi:MAG: hypothetical protein QNL88_16825, partial [Acidobacteriota bacterium]|nr:hypothetical protein [Acidobacteriota bacterium]